MDTLTKQRRSWNMARIRGKDTGPERIVRSSLHSMGIRFRLHRKDLPGNPDIVLPRYRVAVFVHGCFWHRHTHCKYAYTPKSRIEFWNTKFRRNVQRDRQVRRKLTHLGWRVIVVWECETRRPELLVEKLRQVLTGLHNNRVDL